MLAVATLGVLGTGTARAEGHRHFRLAAASTGLRPAGTLAGAASEQTPQFAAPVLPQPRTDTNYTGNFIVDSTDNPGGQNTLVAGDTITVTNGSTYVGQYHTGVFTQNGGIFNSGGLTIGIGYGSNGTFNLNGGTLVANVIYGGFSTNSTSILNLNGGTLQATSSTDFIQGLTAVNVQAGGARIDSNGLMINIQQSFLHASALGGTLDGGLIKLGANSLMLSGTNTYTGPTTLAAGTLTVNAQGALGSTNVINFNGGTLQYSLFNQTDYSSRFSTAANQVYSIDTNGQNVTFYSGLSSAGGSPTKLGSGTLALYGNNSYTGNTTFAGGIVSAYAAGSLGTTGTLSFSGGTLQYGTANQADYSGRFSTAANQAYSIDTNGQNVVFAAGLTSSGGTLTKLGTGSLTLNGTNTYTGGTVIGAGTLEFGSSGALPATGTVQVNSGATLAVPTSVYSTSARLDGVRFAGNITFNSGSSFGIDTGTSAADFTYGTALSGAVGLTKLGTGTGALILSGANTYTGTTTVSAGTLTIPPGASLSPGYGTIVVGAGATFNVAGTINGSGDLTADGTKSGAATVTINNGANVSLSGSRIVLGVTGPANLTQAAGTSIATNSIQLGVNAGGVGTFTQNGGTTSLVTGGSSGQGAGNLQLGITTGSQGAYVLNAGSFSAGTEDIGLYGGVGTFTQNGGTHTVTAALNIGSASTYNLNGGTLQTPGVASSGSAATFSFNGGTLRASTNNAALFEGVSVVQVRGGTNSQGSPYGGAAIDTNGYSVTVGQALVHSTVSGDSATDGGLSKLGAGTLILTAANTYTGTTNVGGGMLQLSNTSGSATGTGLVEVYSGGTLAGTGTTAGNVVAESGGTISPGVAGSGRLNLGSHLVLEGGSTLSIDLGGIVAGTGYDQVNLGTAIALNGGNLSVQTTNGFKLTLGQKFFIVDTNGSPSNPGTFGNAPLGVYTDAAGDRFTVNYLDYDPANGDGVFNDVSLTVLSVVPEPGTWSLLGLGAASLLGTRLRRRARFG